jgi:tetratricopeptide (TPR) repeat protein
MQPTLTTPTVTPTMTPSIAPTLEPTLSPTPTYTPTYAPLPVSYKLDTSRLRYQAQTWNNCGAATLTMGLSYFGYANDQSVAGGWLKPDREDKNVSPYQMVNYVNQEASQLVATNAMYRLGGDLELVKRLLANEFPVIIEKGYDVEDLGWMGHYLLLIGYDDTKQIFYAYDSYLGSNRGNGREESYQDTLFFWKHFNYLFITLYQPGRQQELLSLLGDHADPMRANQIALERASADAQINDNDEWAWFNIGSALTRLGDYERAATAFDRAFTLGMPWRTLWYLFDPYISYFAVGRYQDVIVRSQTTESTSPYVEETFFYRGAAYAMQGNTDGAVNEFNKALRYNSNYDAARIAITAVQNGTFNADLILSYGSGG